MADNDKLKELFARAAEIASVVPESMQEAAFHRALDALQTEAGEKATDTNSPESKRPRRAAPARKSGSTADDAGADGDVVKSFHSLIRDRASGVDAEDTALGKAMALLRVAHDEFGVDGMTSPQIAVVLTEKFRWKVTRQSIGRALDGAGRMVDRSTDGRAYTYRLMAEGEKWLDTSPLNRASSTASSGSGRPISRHVAKGTSKKTTKKAAKGPSAQRPEKTGSGNSAKSTKRPSGRVGPKAAIEGLITDGYFSTPRTMAEIRNVIEERTARKFKPTDLSPTLVRLLRGGALSRSKNSDGQYEYVVPGA